MREIKFRGKTKEGEWIYGDLFHGMDDDIYIHIVDDYGQNVEVLPNTIGQYTGLKDANGKEIYEGDIVRYRLTNELIRLILLYVDRAHCENGYYDIMRSLRALPENGLFPESYIARFNFKHEWIYGKGDRVHTTNHGDGTLDAKVNGSWIVNLDNGNQVVLNENHFKLL